MPGTMAAYGGEEGLTSCRANSASAVHLNGSGANMLVISLACIAKHIIVSSNFPVQPKKGRLGYPLSHFHARDASALSLTSACLTCSYEGMPMRHQYAVVPYYICPSAAWREAP